MRIQTGTLIFSSAGAIWRQGPHQGAQRSSTTSWEVLMASCRSASPASTSYRRAALHEAQRGRPFATAGTLFLVPHSGDEVTFAMGTL